jgi:hypothetical protein
MSAFSQQIHEILLLQSSLLPGEVLQFTLSPSSCHQWQRILDEFSEFQEISPQSETDPPLPPPQFVIKLENAPIWLEIEFSSSPPDRSFVSVKGNISKDDQMKWTSLIEQKTAELHGNE